MGGCYSKSKYTMGEDAPGKKGKKDKKKTDGANDVKDGQNANLNASPGKRLDDKNIPFIDRCSGTLGDRSSILEEDEEEERKAGKPEDEAQTKAVVSTPDKKIEKEEKKEEKSLAAAVDASQSAHEPVKEGEQKKQDEELGGEILEAVLRVAENTPEHKKDEGLKSVVDDILAPQGANEDKPDDQDMQFTREVKIVSTRTVTVESSTGENTTSTKRVVVESSSSDPSSAPVQEILDDLKAQAKAAQSEEISEAVPGSEHTESDGTQVTKYTIEKESEDGVHKTIEVTKVVTEKSAKPEEVEAEVVTSEHVEVTNTMPEVNVEVSAEEPEEKIVQEEETPAEPSEPVALIEEPKQEPVMEQEPVIEPAEPVELVESQVPEPEIAPEVEIQAETPINEPEHIEEQVEIVEDNVEVVPEIESHQEEIESEEKPEETIEKQETIDVNAAAISEVVEDVVETSEPVNGHQEEEEQTIETVDDADQEQVNGVHENGDVGIESEKKSSNFLDQFRDDHKIHAVDFMRIFRQYDKDKSGYLETNEMRSFLKDLIKAQGEKPDAETIENYLDNIMKDADIEKDGRIELGELAIILPVEQNFLKKFPMRERRTKEELDEIFDHYDKDGSGSIGGAELEALLRDMFSQDEQMVTDEQLREYAQLVRELYDINEDGYLGREDIAMLLRKF